jgi:nicotinamide-nucleotide amidase
MNNEVNHFIRTLKKNKLTLALAESVTGGLAAHKLCTGIGTSDIFKGCIVCYDAAVKTALLGVKPDLIAKYSAESEQVTDALARNLARLIPANIHAALTGLASAGGSEGPGKPVGTVFYSVFYKRKMHRMRKVLKGSPLEIRDKAARNLFEFILKTTV